ncbi:unnamed protein product [Leptosia nina]|uniref:Peptidase M14 domain-containing protein n=1 Tax=Leptosia nina TaxID=320188 RepID=A0AAV1K576_9NEOP
MYTHPDLYYHETPTKPKFSKRQFRKYFILNDSKSDLNSDDDDDLCDNQNFVHVPEQKEPIRYIKDDVHGKSNNAIFDRVIEPNYIKETKEKPIQRLDWDNYHRLNVIHKFMDDLEFEYPSICTVGYIGSSLEGRDLKILKVSNSNATNSAVWIDAGIHAREWIAPAVNTYIANHIARNFSTLPASVTNKDWYFLPVVNPDGYEFTHTVDRMWRKNRAWHGGQCLGVDLNRNFSYGWGGKGSSENPTHAFYRGPEPFSEPESCAMRDFLSKSGISFKIYITLHSYGQIILFPFAYRDELCPDYVRLLEGASIMSKAIYECSGNTYKVGISRDVMYGAAGTSNDWCYGAAGIPYCYLIELRSKKHKFKLPEEEIQETGKEILSCVKALMEFIDEKDGVEAQRYNLSLS